MPHLLPRQTEDHSGHEAPTATSSAIPDFADPNDQLPPPTESLATDYVLPGGAVGVDGSTSNHASGHSSPPAGSHTTASHTTIVAVASGVSCAAVAVLVGVGVWLFIQRRNKKKRNAKMAAGQYPNAVNPGVGVGVASPMSPPPPPGYDFTVQGYAPNGDVISPTAGGGMGYRQSMVKGPATPEMEAVGGHVKVAELGA